MGVEDFNLFGFNPGRESWIGFLPVCPQTGLWGRQKAKRWEEKRDKRLSQRQSGSFGRLHLETGPKKGAKRAKNGSSPSKLIRKVLWIGPRYCSSGPLRFIRELIDQRSWQGWAQLGGARRRFVTVKSFLPPLLPVWPEGSIRMHQQWRQLGFEINKYREFYAAAD